MNKWLTLVALAALLTICSSVCLAGPPFLTDDPEPVDYHHWEFYTFGTTDRTADGSSTAGPAIELNNGVAKDTMVHLVMPYTSVSSDGASSERGIGDGELGVKYRFLHQTPRMPEVGTFPLIELPTGNSDKGLGNGRAWVKLPVWAQKSWGQWTSYGGGGVGLNSAPGQDDFGFGGLLLQRQLSPRLTLGGEIYLQGATASGGRYTDFWNAGGYYNFTPSFSLLFSGGHTFAGEGHTISYFGLYWTWGPK